jgi:hypothetical protein
MKNDITTTFLNFVLAVLVFLSVIFAFLFLVRTHQLRQLQYRAQIVQMNSLRAQSLARDVIAYNATAKSQELAQILQSALGPQPAAR